VSTPDAAREYLLAGVMTDIGIEKAARGSPQRPYFGDPREGSHHGFDAGDVFVAEPIGMVRRPGGDLNASVGEEERRG